MKKLMMVVLWALAANVYAAPSVTINKAETANPRTKLILPIPVAAQQGFMILQSGEGQ